MVDQKEMRFLRGRAALAGHDELAGGEALRLAAAAAEEGDAFQAELFRLVRARRGCWRNCRWT